MQINIVDAIINKNKMYNIFISGLDSTILEQIADILSNDFKRVIILNFLHFNLEDNYDINFKEKINTRVIQILKQNENNPQILFILAKHFPIKYIEFKYDYHIHISFKNFYLKEKHIVVDIENYNNIIKENIINKFINYKNNLDDLVDEIFKFIIADIEKKLYKRKNYN